MHFQTDQLYHVFNQGNNKQNIFFNDENYLFFLNKLREYILPYCDVLAWCLMPNHFHIMIKVNCVEIFVTEPETHPMPRNNQNSIRINTHPMTPSHRMSEKLPGKTRTLNDSIAIILRSYTRAINKKYGFSGSLFRAKSKAVCLTLVDEITQAWFQSDGITSMNIQNPEQQYPQVCYQYILQNPVRSGLVRNIEDWEYSSAKDALNLRNGTLINKEVIEEYGLIAR